MPVKHSRRDGYWRAYHLAHTLELDNLVRDIVKLVKENSPPMQVKLSKNNKGRGRKPIHSWDKLVCICILMVILGLSFRDMQNMVPRLGLPWNEPYPDHTTIYRAYNRMPVHYLEYILDRVAYLCIREVGWRKGLIAADSTGVETDRYEKEVAIRPSKKYRCFKMIRRRLYLKYHIIAILDHLIILKAKVTDYRCTDLHTLRGMLKRFNIIPFHGSIFNADRAYDAEYIFKRVYQLGMKPNIKQRMMLKDRYGKGRKRLRYRMRASKEFNEEMYHYRGMIEAVFGGEESDDHNLKTRFRIKEHQEKWGQILAIGWNLKVLNRLRCTKQLGITVKPIINN
jgi:hypothetical protein